MGGGGETGGPGQTENMVSMEILSFDSKMWWEVGLRDKKGVHRVYSQGDMALCSGDASCCVTWGGEEGTREGAENEFLRKESSERTAACPVSWEEEA